MPYGKDGKPPAEPKTRAEQIHERGEAPLLPPNSARYLTAWLFDVGPTAPSSMGEGVIGYRDLLAWQEICGITLLPWEAALLKRLSRAYLGMSQKASDFDCAAPYSGTIDDHFANRATVDDRIRAAFAGLKKGGSDGGSAGR